ncbi:MULTISPECIES: hypothetical protein [Bacillaceae]|uniref:Uncharacterized protein n=1 Tax=Evansella alkalicola TaxID=745819 RepID=A0ABS6JU01_9BACI|nr:MULTISPECIES: hypothetical protein [Bacillaceae]MBU9722063.1 hypothetical protein [Bacillus alkalicola]
MIPDLLLTIAWILVGVRCGIKFVNLLNSRSKDWLEILFYLSVVIITLGILL